MSFISATEIAAAKQLKKEEKRNMREEILKEAKKSYEREKRREEQKKQSGEDVWMVGGVAQRLGFESSADSSERKKAKKKHRERKEAKKRKKKGRERVEENYSSDSGSSGEEGVWVEAGAGGEPEKKISPAPPEILSAPAAAPQRDDWMTMPLGPSDRSMSELVGRKRTREKEEEEKRAEKKLNTIEQPGQHPLELNPFWRDGGEGLPQEQTSTETRNRPRDTRSRVGDGGRSWILRAYKRAMQTAEDEGRSLEDVATDRWGSLEKLHSLLRSAGIDPRDPDRQVSAGRRELLYSRFDDSRDGHRERERRRERGEGDRDRRRGGGRERQDDREDRGGGRREREREREERGRGFMRPGEADSRGEDRRGDRGTRRDRDSKFLRPGDSESNRFAGVDSSRSRSDAFSQNWRKKKPDSDNQSQVSPREISREEEVAEDLPSAMDTSEQQRSCDSAVDPPRTDPEVTLPSEPITDTQLNVVGAKLMKAEMMGDATKVKKLTEELEELRRMKKLQEEEGRGGGGRGGGGGEKKGSVREEKEIVLTTTDRFGRTRPVNLPSSSSSRQAPSRGPTHNKKGKREKYFADDDQYSLKALMEQERMTSAEEMHAAISRMSAKFIPASNAGETVDDVVESKAAMKHNPAKEEERQRQRAILESRKMAEVLEKCKLCFDNPSFSKSLLVAVGLNTYLALPSHMSLTEGHCLIVPMEHAMCSMGLDENVWSEIQIFRKGLTRMFSDRDMDVVFMETYTSVKSRSHMFIDCIPVPKDEGAMAPMYFKKAILESDEEWAQNRKLIDTSKKGVRGSIPAGLPYFFAEFGLDGGFGHIIEDLSKFPPYFGREVVGGLVDAEPRLWLKPPRESFDDQKRKVLQFSEWWKPYDWTQQLKEKT